MESPVLLQIYCCHHCAVTVTVAVITTAVVVVVIIVPSAAQKYFGVRVRANTNLAGPSRTVRRMDLERIGHHRQTRIVSHPGAHNCVQA